EGPATTVGDSPETSAASDPPSRRHPFSGATWFGITKYPLRSVIRSHPTRPRKSGQRVLPVAECSHHSLTDRLLHLPARTPIPVRAWRSGAQPWIAPRPTSGN